MDRGCIGHRSERIPSQGTLPQRSVGGFGTSRIAQIVLPLLICALFAACAHALDPLKNISQYGHSVWRIQDGLFSGAPGAITQTTDGYLWIASEGSLLRFDGVRFVAWKPPEGQGQLSQVLSLLGSKNGNLWIGMDSGLASWDGKKLVRYDDAPGMIVAIIEKKNGEIWFLRNQFAAKGGSDICRTIGNKTRCHDEGKNAFKFAEAMVDGPSGDLWVGGETGVLHWTSEGSAFYGRPGLIGNNSDGVTALTRGRDDSVWVGVGVKGSGLGLQQLKDGNWKTFRSDRFNGEDFEISTLLLDKDENLWVGSTRGLFKIRGSQVDHFGVSDGLSADEVMSLFEDKEGNIWAGTALGLDCFHDLRVTNFSRSQGLTSNEVNAVLASRSGEVLATGPNMLDTLRIGDTYSVVPWPEHLRGQVTALLQDHGGRLWYGIDNSLFVKDNHQTRTVHDPTGKSIGLVLGLAEDVDGNIWAETKGSERALLRIRDFRVQERLTAPQIPNARKIAADLVAGIWLGLMSGDLARYAQGKLDIVPFNQNPTPTQNSMVYDLLVAPNGGVMGATSSGVIAWHDGRKQTMTVRNGLPCDNVFALARDNHGGVWLNTKCGYILISRSELDGWWKDPRMVLKVTTLDAIDGAFGAYSPFNSSTKSPDGRIWFANNMASLRMVDPNRLNLNPFVPPVYVEDIVADRKRYAANGVVALPPITRDIQISYTALSFTAPQKVRFRYRLENHDSTWQDAGTRREAFYSDLAPGNYRFRVIACNNEGLWNEVGATLDFRIIPAWYQTLWFRVLIGITALLLLWLVHRLRLRQVAHAITIRSNERLAERTRIARNLHDTLLQTIQSSKIISEHALEKRDDPEAMGHAMERIFKWLKQAAQEGRDALNSLRTSNTTKNDLSDAIQRALYEDIAPGSMKAGLEVRGEPRTLHPVVQDEIYLIASEAIRNAYLHSSAIYLLVELEYGRDLSLRVHDNGLGISQQTAADGKPGHFGLVGMRERAKRIGANIQILGSHRAGTTITLQVKGSIAFASERDKYGE